MTMPSSSPRDCARRSTRPHAQRTDASSARVSGRDVRPGGRVTDDKLSVTKMNTHLALLALAGSIALLAAQDQAATQGETPSLKLEAKVPIGNVRGRLDHMAIDLARQ